MKLTRRQMVVATALAPQVLAQTSAGDVGTDFAKQARDGVTRNAETLAKFEIPLSTEPAFQFKA